MGPRDRTRCAHPSRPDWRAELEEERFSAIRAAMDQAAAHQSKKGALPEESERQIVQEVVERTSLTKRHDPHFEGSLDHRST